MGVTLNKSRMNERLINTKEMEQSEYGSTIMKVGESGDHLETFEDISLTDHPRLEVKKPPKVNTSTEEDIFKSGKSRSKVKKPPIVNTYDIRVVKR
jgi:hypothetical protein